MDLNEAVTKVTTIADGIASDVGEVINQLHTQVVSPDNSTQVNELVDVANKLQSVSNQLKSVLVPSAPEATSPMAEPTTTVENPVPPGQLVNPS